MAAPEESITLLSVPGGTTVTTPVPMSARSFITKILAASGNAGAFTLELFSQDPTVVVAAGGNIENYRVCPLLTAVSGIIANYPAQPLLYVNQDTPKGRTIYARTTGAGFPITLTLSSYSSLGGA
jgi:hypothetical protein